MNRSDQDLSHVRPKKELHRKRYVVLVARKTSLHRFVEAQLWLDAQVAGECAASGVLISALIYTLLITPKCTPQVGQRFDFDSICLISWGATGTQQTKNQLSEF